MIATETLIYQTLDVGTVADCCKLLLYTVTVHVHTRHAVIMYAVPTTCFGLCNRTGVVYFSFWLRVLDKAVYSTFESTLNSLLSYRVVPVSYLFVYVSDK